MLVVCALGIGALGAATPALAQARSGNPVGAQRVNRGGIDALVDLKVAAHCQPDDAVGRLKRGIWRAGQLLRAGADELGCADNLTEYQSRHPPAAGDPPFEWTELHRIAEQDCARAGEKVRASFVAEAAREIEEITSELEAVDRCGP